MEIKEESGLKFGFPHGSHVIKFDDTNYYRNLFNSFPESKGVDFIAVEKDSISFIEVKNCLGNEAECRWRIKPNNRNRETTAAKVNVEGRDSLDIEVPQKVTMTLAALVGARSFGETKSSLEELKDVVEAVFSEDFINPRKKKYIILFLEGEFGGHTRSKKMIMSELQKSMRAKLKWLNCKVSVVDSSTYDKKVFQIIA